MIKIGTKKDLDKIAHLPMNVQKAICEDIKILDENYGENRNIDRDMGGFVVICDRNEQLDIANFDREKDEYETIQNVYPYVRKHFISGTERNIVIYERG